MKRYMKSEVQRKFRRKVGSSLRSFDMIGEGDNILVAVSGGKDSLSMLDVLLSKKKYIPVKFDITAVHVLNDYDKDPDRKKEILQEVFKKMRVAYLFKYAPLKTTGKGSSGRNECFWCSWMRRRVLFDLAAKENFNKIALGHNKDDIAQTVLLNMVYNGNISGMKPVQELFDGGLKLIRPLSEMEEDEIFLYAEEKGLLLNLPKCERENDSKRAVVKEVIDQLSAQNPEIKTNIMKAPSRIRGEYIAEFNDD